ncbi:ABC1 kinase family protein [Pseudanabaena sp. PCC 6802]|uniref:ABC1 kinase family protein n=1 Tax=Pseudanabaena sp. PCC 6802 TaxID=118173 RepID=UPI00034D49AE|nr:AarF/ABC1/UbiB kinase family protein [Pseudanabaena sp. PCC 6802]
MLTTADSKQLSWQKTSYSPFARQRDVFLAAFTFIFFLWWDNLWQHDSPLIRKRRAKWLVAKLLDLGPTFIKIGQSLSTRVDLLPLEYIEELSQLQDRVPQFEIEAAIAIVETELGKSLYSIYRDFEEEPIAAASLGQVHKARLHTGEDVVVKIQRPGLKPLFDLDFVVVGQLLRFLRRWFTWIRKYQLEAVYNEFFTILYQEIDYIQEGKNADRFRTNFADYPSIVVPSIYWQYSSSKVLTMAYVPGIKVDDLQALEACNLNPKTINQLGISCYLKQLLQDGFFHADPHPGNLAVTNEGNLIFYDYGMMSEIKAMDKDKMVRTFFAVLKKDTNEVIDTLTSMGLIETVADMAPVKRMMKFVLDKFTEKPIDVKAFEQIKGEMYELFEQQPFRLPSKMTYILKSLTTLDGIARILDPEYNFTAAAQPFVKSMTLSKGKGSALTELAKQARSFIAYKLNQPSGTELLLRRLEERMEQGELRVLVRSAESDRALKRINLGVKCSIYACLSGFTLLTGAVLLVGASGTYAGWAIAAFVCSGLCFIALMRSLVQLSIRERLDRLAE